MSFKFKLIFYAYGPWAGMHKENKFNTYKFSLKYKFKLT